MRKHFVPRRYTNSSPVVYRFVSTIEKVTKYVGIAESGRLPQRIKEHLKESWCSREDFEIQYIEVANKAEAEALEAHFITLYETGKYYNTAKADWGLLSFCPDVEWIMIQYHFKDLFEEMERQIARYNGRPKTYLIEEWEICMAAI